MPGLPHDFVTNNTTTSSSSYTALPSTSTSATSQKPPLSLILPILFGILAMLILLIVLKWYKTRPKRITTDTEVAPVDVTPTLAPGNNHNLRNVSSMTERWKQNGRDASTPPTAAPPGYYAAHLAHSRGMSAIPTANLSTGDARAHGDKRLAAVTSVTEMGSVHAIDDDVPARRRADSEVTLVEPPRRPVDY